MILDARVHNGRLYVGGYFSQINGIDCYNVAYYDGTRWQPVIARNWAAGLYIPYYSKLAFGAEGIYFGPYYLINDNAYEYISNDDYMTTLTVDDRDSLLYVGGSFQSIENKQSHLFGIYRINHFPTVSPVMLELEEDFGSYTIDFTNSVTDPDNDPLEIGSVYSRSNNSVVDFSYQGMQVILTSKNNQYGTEVLRVFINDLPFTVVDSILLTVKSVNNPPSAPVPSQPARYSEISDFLVEFQWFASFDADQDSIRYNLHIYADTLQQDTTIMNIDFTRFLFSGDSFFLSNVIYYWYVEASDGQAVTVSDTSQFLFAPVTGIEDEPTIPKEYAFGGNYPNPFNPVSHFDDCFKLIQSVLPTCPHKREGRKNKTLSFSYSGLTMKPTHTRSPEKEKIF